MFNLSVFFVSPRVPSGPGHRTFVIGFSLPFREIPPVVEEQVRMKIKIKEKREFYIFNRGVPRMICISRSAVQRRWVCT
jgi:hypothetical protein